MLLESIQPLVRPGMKKTHVMHTEVPTSSKQLIPVKVTNVTGRGCYHFRWSESLRNQNKSWFFVNDWDSCKIRDS